MDPQSEVPIPSPGLDNIDAFNVTVAAISAKLFESFPEARTLSAWDVWGDVYTSAATARFHAARLGGAYDTWESRVLDRVGTAAQVHGAMGGDGVSYFLDGIIGNLRVSGDHDDVADELEVLAEDWKHRLLPVFDGTLDFLVSEGVIRTLDGGQDRTYRLSASAAVAMMSDAAEPIGTLSPRGEAGSHASSSGGQLVALLNVAKNAAAETVVSESVKPLLPLLLSRVVRLIMASPLG